MKVGILFLVTSVAFAQVWEIENPHSSVQFKIKHMAVTNVNGSLTDIQGKFDLNDEDFEKTTAEGVIKVASINTANTQRDEHLRGPDFFDVKKFPSIDFRSKKAWIDNGVKKISGDLKMHGVEKEVILDVQELSAAVKDMNGELRRGMTATTRINRKDFGLTYGKILDGGLPIIGDNVDITLDLQLVQPSKEVKKISENKSKKKK